MSGPLVAGVVLLLLEEGVLLSCSDIIRSVSACPNSPVGVLARNPAVGSDVTFCTGGAGYFVLFLVCGVRVCWSKCLHSPGLYVWFSVHLPSLLMHPGQVHVGVSMSGYLHSPNFLVCLGSYLL